jgi:hypothetical protein
MYSAFIDFVKTGIRINGRPDKDKNPQTDRKYCLAVLPGNKEQGKRDESEKAKQRGQIQPGTEEYSGYPDTAKINE